MSYVVNWHGAGGQPGWHRVGDLQEAAAHVEHLRNAEGVEVTRIFRLEEVAFELRPYFRVELAETAPTVSQPDVAMAEASTMPSFATLASTTPEPDVAPEAVAAAVAQEPPADPVWGMASTEDVAPLSSQGDPEPAVNGSARRGLFGR